MEWPKISIITPVYNAEEYINTCLEGLINQTYKNIEILCINDGSKDNSLEIVKSFQKRDNRVKIFTQKNSGPARARNVGLQNASGEYIMFCDADDWYEPKMCEVMVSTILKKDVDVVMCNNNVHGNYSKKRYFDCVETRKVKKVGFHKINEKFLLQMNVILWNKIWKKTLIDKYNISFPDGYEQDDDAFIFQYFFVAKKYFGIEDSLYNHRILRNSVMGNFFLRKNTGKKYDRIYSMKFVYEFLTKNNLLNKKTVHCYLELFRTGFLFVWPYLNSFERKKYLLLTSKILKIVDLKYFEHFNKDFLTQLGMNETREAMAALNTTASATFINKARKTIKILSY